jgi:hypothetical protein
MNKIYGNNLRFNSHLNGKNHQPTFNDLVFVCKYYQKAKCYQPISVCEFKLN